MGCLKLDILERDFVPMKIVYGKSVVRQKNVQRFNSIDPMEAKYAGMSPYNYSMNNPVMMSDPSGADPYQTDTGGVNVKQAPTYTTPDGSSLTFQEKFSAQITIDSRDFELEGGDTVHLEANVLFGFTVAGGDYKASFEKRGGEWKFNGYKNQFGEFYKFSQVDSESDNEYNSELSGTSAISVYDASKRENYKTEIEKMSKAKEAKVLAAESEGNVVAAEKAAEEAFDARNNLRENTQKKLSPGGKAVSSVLDQKREFKDLVKKYGVDDLGNERNVYETMREVAKASGRSNKSLIKTTPYLRGAGIIFLLWSLYDSIKEIYNTKEGKRTDVAKREGRNLTVSAVGGAFGSIIAVTLLAFIGGLLALSPVGWVVIAASIIGGVIGAIWFDSFVKRFEI